MERILEIRIFNHSRIIFCLQFLLTFSYFILLYNRHINLVNKKVNKIREFLKYKNPSKIRLYLRIITF